MSLASGVSGENISHVDYAKYKESHGILQEIKAHLAKSGKTLENLMEFIKETAELPVEAVEYTEHLEEEGSGKT